MCSQILHKKLRAGDELSEVLPLSGDLTILKLLRFVLQFIKAFLFYIFVFVASPTLVRAKPFHLLTQTARLLKSLAGAFIVAQPQGRSKHIFTRRDPIG